MPFLDDLTRAARAAVTAFRAAPRRPQTPHEARAATRWTQAGRQVPTLSAWDAEDVLAAMRAHAHGNFRTSALLADWLAQSDAVSAPLQALQRSILGLPASVEGVPGSVLSAALAARFSGQWSELMPRGVVAEVVRWCALFGFCIVERRWHLDPIEGRWTATPRPIHPAWVRWDWSRERFVVSTIDGEDVVEPGLGTRYAVFVDLDASRPWMSGAILPLGILALIAWWSDRDGARWSERHGLPPIGAKVPMDQWDSPKTDRFIADLAELGTEPIVRLPTDTVTGHGFDLEWKELKNQEAWKGFLEQGRDVRTRAATMILGQPLTTQAGVQGSGSYALGRVHAQVRQDVMESYAVLLGSAREHIVAPLVWLNDLPSDREARREAPMVRYDAAPPADHASLAQASKARADAVAAWRDAGVAVDAEAEAIDAGVKLLAKPQGVRSRAAAPAAERRAAAGQAWVDDLHESCVQAAPAAMRAGILGDVRAELKASLGYADMRRRAEALRRAASPDLATLAEGAVLAAGAAGALSAGPGDGG